MHSLREVGGDQAIAEPLDLGPLRIRLSQLALDRPELLAEQVLPLFLPHLVLGLARDLLSEFQHLELLGQVAVDQPERLDAGGHLEQRLLLRHVQAHHRPDEKGEDQRIGCLGRELVDIRPTLRMRQLQRPGRQFEHGAVQGLDLRPMILREGQGAYPGLEIRLGLLQMDQLHPFHALDQELDPRCGAAHLLDDGPGAHGIEIVRRRHLHLGVAQGDARNVFSSVARIASTAAIERGRPIERGMNSWGKRTEFDRGSTGTDSGDTGFASMIDWFSIVTTGPLS